MSPSAAPEVRVTTPRNPGAAKLPEASRFDVSILVPTYNSGSFIEAAIRSALTQLGAKIEVVVQDGGSTDRTVDVLAGFADPRLHWYTEPDAGQADALNRALQRAMGEFVMWLNADDLLMQGGVVALVRAAREQHLDVVHGNFEIIDQAGSLIKPYTSAPLDRIHLIRHGTYIFSGALLVRRTLLLEVGGFDADLHYCMDYDLLLSLAEKRVAAGNIPQAVAQFRRQPDSKTESGWLPVLREWLAVGRRHGATRTDGIRTAVVFGAYNLLKPLWRSRAWLSVRPHKHLGGT